LLTRAVRIADSLSAFSLSKSHADRLSALPGVPIGKSAVLPAESPRYEVVAISISADYNIGVYSNGGIVCACINFGH